MEGFSAKLQQAIEAGMVEISYPPDKNATILGPGPGVELTDDEWVALLDGASEIAEELRRLGYQVST
jgi:hypothetical protein